MGRGTEYVRITRDIRVVKIIVKARRMTRVYKILKVGRSIRL